jgi:hypothetical protein
VRLGDFPDLPRRLPHPHRRRRARSPHSSQFPPPAASSLSLFRRHDGVSRGLPRAPEDVVQFAPEFRTESASSLSRRQFSRFLAAAVRRRAALRRGSERAPDRGPETVEHRTALDAGQLRDPSTEHYLVFVKVAAEPSRV